MTIKPDPSKLKKPGWLKVKLPTHKNYFYVSELVKKRGLNTICRSAHCPNISECWAHKTATFLILGDICTRNCAFCAVRSGTPSPPACDEPAQIAEAITAMELKYAVITSVTRDDLPDGGASVFAEVIKTIRKRDAGIRLEVLIPDFQGNREALAEVNRAGPDVLNHNLEVPENLYPSINRNSKSYTRSLQVLERAHRMGAVTKSGIMLGLGETQDDILRTLRDLRKVKCKFLTIGQYLQPGRGNPPVIKYYPPTEFETLKSTAVEMGFSGVVSGPLVRSSYMAHKLYQDGIPSETKRH